MLGLDWCGLSLRIWYKTEMTMDDVASYLPVVSLFRKANPPALAHTFANLARKWASYTRRLQRLDNTRVQLA